MPSFIIHHVTRYAYEEPVTDSANQILLYPLKDEQQTLVSQQLVISGNPIVALCQDYYGNQAGTFMNVAPHKELLIDSTIEVITTQRQLPGTTADPSAEWNFLREQRHSAQFIDFLKQEYFEGLPEIRTIADETRYHSLSVYAAAQQLTEHVYTNFKYIQGITSVETTLEEIWRLKAGVCQDFAHILLVMLRLLGIPARYVSGYVCPKDAGMRGEGATHAWVEAYIPFYGWLGFDPTNNCVVNDLHVRLAVGRDFSDCSPVRGTYKGTSKQQLEVGVSVAYEDGAVSKEAATVLTPQPVPVTNGKGETNSYRKHMEMMQQQ